MTQVRGARGRNPLLCSTQKSNSLLMNLAVNLISQLADSLFTNSVCIVPGVRTVTRASTATSAYGTLDVCTGPVTNHGSATATRDGEVCSVTRTSTTARTTNRARTAPPVRTRVRGHTRVPARRDTRGPTARS